MKLKKSYLPTLFLIIASIEYPFESHVMHLRIMLIANLIVFVEIIAKNRKIKGLIVIYIGLYTAIMGVSTALMFGFTLNILYAVGQGLFIYNIFAAIAQNTEKNSKLYDLKVMTSLFGVILLVNDLVVISPISFHDEYEELFLVGNKFSVAYMHMILLVFVYELQKEKNKLGKDQPFLFWFWSGLSILINIPTGSTTGLLTTAILIVGLLLQDKFSKLLNSKIVFFAFFLVINLVVVSFGVLVNNPVIASFIKNRLSETISITGRYRIYEKLPEIVMKHPFLGYGFDCTVVADVVGFGNAQNGILHICVQYGLAGAAAFLLVVYEALTQYLKGSRKRGSFLVIIYVMMLISTVEINFNWLFYIPLAFCCAKEGTKK